jgi:hypothetical protein
MAQDNKAVGSNLVSGGTGYSPEVEIRKPGKIVLYSVTEPELRAVSDKDGENIFLTAFFSFLSISATLSITIFTVSFRSEFERGIFHAATVAFIVITIACFFIYRCSHRKTKRLLIEILNREP